MGLFFYGLEDLYKLFAWFDISVGFITQVHHKDVKVVLVLKAAVVFFVSLLGCYQCWK